MKQFAHIILSCWLALLLLFGGTAKEFIHLFTSHQDTVHTYHKQGELTFENEHHHCTFLNFSLTPFDSQEFLLSVFSKQIPFFSFSDKLAIVVFKPVANLLSLRGPPIFTIIY